MDGHHRTVGRNVLRLQFLDPSAELGDRHLRVALQEIARRKDGVRIEPGNELGEPRHLVLGGILEICRVSRAVLEHEIHRAVFAIDHHAAGVRRKDGRLFGVRGVGQEHVEPAAAPRRCVTDVEHAVGEVLEEDSRLDFVFGSSRYHAVDDLAEGLVGGRHRDEHDVARRGPGQHRDQQHGPQQAIDADAARLKRDRLAIGRQAAEGDQEPDEQRYRDRDRQRLRHERHQYAQHDRPRHALGDQPFAVVRERWNEQQEREDEKPDQEGQQQFTDNIAVNNPQHTDAPDHTT